MLRGSCCAGRRLDGDDRESRARAAAARFAATSLPLNCRASSTDRGAHQRPSKTIAPSLHVPHGTNVGRACQSAARSATRITSVPTRWLMASSRYVSSASSRLDPMKKHSIAASGTACTRPGASRTMTASPSCTSRGCAAAKASVPMTAAMTRQQAIASHHAVGGAAVRNRVASRAIAARPPTAATTNTGRTLPRSQTSEVGEPVAFIMLSSFGQKAYHSPLKHRWPAPATATQGSRRHARRPFRTSR